MSEHPTPSSEAGREAAAQIYAPRPALAYGVADMARRETHSEAVAAQWEALRASIEAAYMAEAN